MDSREESMVWASLFMFAKSPFQNCQEFPSKELKSNHDDRIPSKITVIISVDEVPNIKSENLIICQSQQMSRFFVNV